MTLLPQVGGIAVRYFEEPARAFRYAAATRTSSGLMAAGAKTQIQKFRASIHPAPAELLDRLPEGQRTRTTIVVYTRTLLKTAQQTAGLRADVVEYSFDGAEAATLFEVEDVRPWRWGNYYEILAQETRDRA